MSNVVRNFVLCAAICGGVASVGGCMVGPDPRPAQTAVPEQWSAELARGLTTSSPQLARWWSVLGDRLLDDLIRRAIAGNTDMKSAIARVREARANRGEAGAQLFPTLDANASYTHRRTAVGSSVSSSPEIDTFTTGFDAGWEVDIFGGVRRTIEQRQAELEAARADLGNVLVSTLAEVARNYVDMRSLQARIGIAESNVRSQSDTLELVELRRDAGLADELEAAQARYNLSDTKSRIPPLQTSLAAARNRLAVLLGVSSGSLDRELASPAPVPSVPMTVAVGMSADLLRRRPDVARAEQQLIAATAAIGVATADLYPKLTLSGSVGLTALDIGSLTSPSSRVWSIGPSLTWNVFDAGRIRQRIKASSARQEQALAAYEGAVLAAYEEAENALVAFVREQVRRDNLTDTVSSAVLANQLARTRYRSGLIDFQQVLETERARLAFEEQLAQSSAAVTTDLIAIYKALGGGWESVTFCGDRPCDASSPAAPTAPATGSPKAPNASATTSGSVSSAPRRRAND